MRAASGGARRVPQPPPTGEPSEGPSAEDLAAPQSFVEAATASGLLALVQQSQETCVQVAALFDDIFEFYVTAGRAAEYPGLVDRFKLRFGALRSNLDRAAAALDGEHAPIALLVRDIAEHEAARLELQLETQVLRQRLSMSDDSPDKPELQQRLREVTATASSATDAIFEALEALSAEAADLVLDEDEGEEDQ